MNEQNVTVEITAVVSVNGVVVNDASVTVGSVKIEQLVIPVLNVA